MHLSSVAPTFSSTLFYNHNVDIGSGLLQFYARSSYYDMDKFHLQCMHMCVNAGICLGRKSANASVCNHLHVALNSSFYLCTGVTILNLGFS